MPADMPEEVQAIVDVIGNHVRTEILRRLAHHPQSAVDLAAQMDVSHSRVHRHLVKLEAHGLVTADTESGRRAGRTVLWQTVLERVVEVGQAWIAYASGQE